MVDKFTGGLSFGIFRQPFFLICLFVYLLHLGLAKAGFTVPLLRFYLNDLVCLPLVLSVTLFLQRSFVYRSGAYVFSGYQVGLAVVYFSVAFELVFPPFMPRYTADAFDVLAYALGGLAFYRFLNSPAA